MSALADKYMRKADVHVGAVRELPSGEIAISRAQRNVHVFFEALALPAAGVCAYMAYTNKSLPEWQKWFLYGMAGTTIIVDGGLLLSYAKEKR